MLEVEQKFRVADLSQLEQRLAALGAIEGTSDEQIDRYQAHPCRDFASTDEALRLRRSGSRHYITYKGPKLDATTKTRREIEIELPNGDAAESQWVELLEALGFKPVTEVRKYRRHLSVDWQGREIDVALDDVAELGHYVELEIVMPPADVEKAKACIASLAAQLGLTESERRSYLELLLEQRGR